MDFVGVISKGCSMSKKALQGYFLLMIISSILSIESEVPSLMNNIQTYGVYNDETDYWL